MAVLIAGWLFADRLPFAAAGGKSDRPHVILLGIDSLRLEELSRYGGKAGNTSHIDQFIADADLVKDTSTPMARTFGSWVAILTGRSPPETGARNNLTPRDAVEANPTIADVLRGEGYQTVYSTDEVRFANIDESYGFDRVVTPPIGASDFILGTYNELPLASVVINTWLGQLLFPFSYGNRGAAQVFEPKTYLARLDRELDFRQPTFLVVHLTAAHWPYYTASTPFGMSVKKNPEDRPMYRIGLRTADSMFDQVVSMLRRKGALDNAIVVVLSDHGEAMLLPNDAIVKHGAFVEGLGAPLKVLDVGHGQSVLSQTQYKVLLGFKSFGNDQLFVSKGRELPALGTVEDIAPTLLDLLGIGGDPLATSGQSLAPLLRNPAAAADSKAPERIRYTETDLAVIPNVEGEVDETGTARENSKFFGVDNDTSRMHIHYRMLPLVHAFKERAAFTAQHLLAAMPAGPDAHQYVYFDIATGNGRLLLERPGPELMDGQRLWDALDAHFPGELRPATRVTVADWPRIANQWTQYLTTHDVRGAAVEADVPPPAGPSAAGDSK
jgi:arylsulfatase A-like enzyme